ncbi:hypothetical protein M0Q50_03255 [bacterium]|jgi:hypothetical protein|nr:hypothetical protein [bacterium]
MKTGDIIICKKDKDISLIKNKKYVIFNSESDYFTYHPIIIICEDKKLYGFTQNNELDNYFYDYFYTEEELRKMKLDSL